MNQVTIFVLSFIAGPLFWRSLFYIAPHILEKPFTRSKTGLHVHHIHYGILLVLMASVYLLLKGASDFVFALLGLGLGLMLDEFIPSLLLPGDRLLELKIYKKSLHKTIWLLVIVVVIILLLSLM